VLDVRQQPSPTLPRAVRRSTGEGPRVPPSRHHHLFCLGWP